MSDNLATAQAQNAFRRARGKAFLRAVWFTLQRRSNRLLAYDEVRARIHAGGPVYRGIQAVPIDKIVGSVDRFRDFDRAFLPSQDFTEERWQSVGRAYYSDVNLPPVKLYQIGEVYFVVDGNHRVSVARELGREFIDAKVQEVRGSVPLTSDIEAGDLEVIGERADFMEQTKLAESCPGSNIECTIAGGYHLLLEHIEVHRYLQSTEWSREFSFAEASAQWYDQVYLPIVQTVRHTDILHEFPGRTETDLYVWLMDHLYFLRQRFGDKVSPTDAAFSFASHFTPRFAHRLWHWLTVHVLRIGRQDEP